MSGASNGSLPIERVLAMLAKTPPRLDALTVGLTPAQLRTAPEPGEWSATEVLAHLRACADMWGGCIKAMLAEDRPTIRAVNPRAWIKQTNYRDLDFHASLGVFATQRAALLVALERLPPDGWLRAATVTGAGKVLERTVITYVRWLARHERPHIKQIAHIANTVRMMHG